MNREQIVEGIGTACVLLGYIHSEMTINEAVAKLIEMSDEDKLTVKEAKTYLNSICFEEFKKVA